MNEIWILGASGRAGRAIAAALAAKGLPTTFVGRNARSLAQAARSLSVDAKVVVASTIDDIAAEIRRASPRVVVNTIGPFSRTAVSIVNACPPGTHYLDVGNELPALLSLFAMNDDLISTGRCTVPGSGWGVLGTESIVLKLCEGRPPAAKVRVDNMAAIEGSGALGPTLAETIVDGMVYGGRRYAGGQLKSALAGSDHEKFILPDGTTVETGLIASGELEAARRASGAADVVAGFAGVPGGPIRFVIPALSPVLLIPGVRRFAEARLAKIEPPPATRDVSWSRARVVWQDGTSRTAWLRAGDGYAFLGKASAAVAQRLLEGRGRPGCFTPASLFGSDLAIEAGGEFKLDPETRNPRER